MKTNEIKKGMIVRLNNGWFGKMYDNTRGNTRCVEVYGYFTEAGEVYSHDIVKCFGHVTLEKAWKTDLDNNVEHTKSQLKLKEQAEYFDLISTKSR